MQAHTEKRAAARTPYTQIVTFELSLMKAGQLSNVQKDGHVVDISRTGMGLTTDHALEKGAVLKVSMPLDTVMDVRMPVFSEVVWITPDDGRYRAGLRFLV